MNDKQMAFDSLFRGHIYGPTDGFEPLKWQEDCLKEFLDALAVYRDMHVGNGEGSRFVYTLYAGTGSGKTKASAVLASHLLNAKFVRNVVVVVPNNNILRKTLADFRRYFQIELRPFNKNKFADGVPPAIQGYILTYQRLLSEPDLHRVIAGYDPMLVIFDEVHHLGDKNGWCAAATEAFGRAAAVLPVTGTPYRSDDAEIPFVSYWPKDEDGLTRFRAEAPYGFKYSLGRAIVDGVCRKPLFNFFDATVKGRFRLESGELWLTADDVKASDTEMALWLRGAVDYRSSDRMEMLRSALAECRRAGRKVIIFLGGDTEGDQTPTIDATELLPMQLVELGYTSADYEVVTGDDKHAHAKLAAFGASEKWILVSINMASEGTDIPEISTEIFLTTISAKQTTEQRIGRGLRKRGAADPIVDTWVYMFRHPMYVELQEQILSDITREQKLRVSRGEREGGGAGDPPRHRAEAIGVGDGRRTHVAFHGRMWPIDVFEAERRRMIALGLPTSMLHIALELLRDQEPQHADG